MSEINVANRQELLNLMREAMAELHTENPALITTALAGNPEALRAAFAQAGIIVSQPVTPRPEDVLAAYRGAQASGRILSGFGTRYRRGMDTRRIIDVETGRERHTYIFGDTEELCERWFRAFMNGGAEKIDPVSGESIRVIGDKVNTATRATRAPATPLTADIGQAGGYLVPTVIAAEIFELLQEAFVLRQFVEVFVSATPLEINREIAKITISRGAAATDLQERDFTGTISPVKLSPERVGMITYVEPRLAVAASVGPVRWIISRIAEALAKDIQRTIIAGVASQREPRGITTLQTASANDYDNMRTQAWTDTDNQSRRDSFRKALYKLQQGYRDSPRFVWVMNNDGVQKAASLNDVNQTVFSDGAAGQFPTLFRRPIIESTALVTSGTTSALGCDMRQYAWLESPDGLRIEQSTVGGQAWASDTIGIKMVQWIDGAPVQPIGFVQVTGIVP